MEKINNYLINNYWIVPKQTLKCQINNSDPNIKFGDDQTVWHITGVENGYVKGISYTTIDNVPTSKYDFNGSIDNNGNVLFTFNNSITAVGKFKYSRKNQEYIFEMQMNTNVINHWSYMIPTNKTKSTYYKLPGIFISVPEFINLF